MLKIITSILFICLFYAEKVSAYAFTMQNVNDGSTYKVEIEIDKSHVSDLQKVLSSKYPDKFPISSGITVFNNATPVDPAELLSSLNIASTPILRFYYQNPSASTPAERQTQSSRASRQNLQKILNLMQYGQHAQASQALSWILQDPNLR